MTEAAVTADDVKYTAKSEIQENNVSPKIHIIFTCPSGKTELLSKFEKLGDHEYTGNFNFSRVLFTWKETSVLFIRLSLPNRKSRWHQNNENIIESWLKSKF